MKKVKSLTSITTIVRMVILGVLIICLPIMLSACKLYTVVKINQNNSLFENSDFSSDQNNFNGDKYVNSIWNSQVLPYISKKAVDLTQVLNALKQNVDRAGKQYGIRDNSEGSSWNFLVKGRGKIVALNTTSRAGTADLDLPPYDGKKDLALQIGPVIRGTSLRDSMEFISFDNFENQIVFAQLGDAFNKKVYKQILSKIKFAALKGKEIEFSGAFTMGNLSDIVLTPILLKEK